MTNSTTTPPQSFGVLLFPGFALLDACGPLELLNGLSSVVPITVQRLCPTHTLDDCPPLDVLIIPGGFGVPNASQDERVLKFIADSKAQTIITICNGAGILASTGLLDGKKATTNKWWFKEVTSARPEVNWVQKARWVHEGRFWTSSGISSGLDVVAAYIRETYGEKIGELIPDILEYTPELNPDNDPFVDTWKKHVPANQTK
ncbi:class I glutamine amidotransferase-like protein [Umbelopsis sp. AD052]|nr:class I glutamine amidotransferase-like protein [Umbelopsis sp. AD052]